MKRNSLISVGFSLILFLMFVVGSFFLLYYGANSYRNNLEKEEIKERVEIPFAYVSTRIRQASGSDSLAVETIENRNVLVIKNDNSYTLIYYLDGGLYELMISDFKNCDLKGGSKIADIDDFDMEYKDNCYLIKINDEQFKIGVRK